MMFLIKRIRPFQLFGILPTISRNIRFIQKRNCYSIFGIKDLVQHEKWKLVTDIRYEGNVRIGVVLNLSSSSFYHVLFHGTNQDIYIDTLFHDDGTYCSAEQLMGITYLPKNAWHADCRPDTFSVMPIESFHHEMAIRLAKRYFLAEHVFVHARRMDLCNDCAIDEYITGLLKQGNSLFAKTEDDRIAGFCINFAASPVDPPNLRNFAFYRQDPNIKDFLYYTAKLQETPNLWNIFEDDKVFEIKMLAVLPEYRRQGLATMLVQKSKTQAKDQGYKIIRMDCINPYDYKIAERCMLSCLVKFPLHKLRGPKAAFIGKNSEHNRHVRVYVDAPLVTSRVMDFESMFQ